jgi:hypothetical protein
VIARNFTGRSGLYSFHRRFRSEQLLLACRAREVYMGNLAQDHLGTDGRGMTLYRFALRDIPFQEADKRIMSAELRWAASPDRRCGRVLWSLQLHKKTRKIITDGLDTCFGHRD